MNLCKEIYRDEYSFTRKELFYNEQKQIIGQLETYQSEAGDNGYLSVYEYTGEDYRIIRYLSDTKSYKAFIAKGRAVFKEAQWHIIEEAAHIHEFKYEKGLLVAEYSHDIQYNSKTSMTCSYRDGLKISETRINGEGTVQRIEFGYRQQFLQSATTFVNNQFLEQIIYVYGNGEMLLEKQKFLKHRDTQYLSHQENFFYNAQNKLQKTESHGRYDGHLCLYKIEENLWQGNVLTKKMALISNIDWVIGYYNMDALYEMLRREHAESLIPLFDKHYPKKTGFDVKTQSVETYDNHQQPVSIESINPDNREVMFRVSYRNEYNEAAMPEFVISYRLEEGKMVEAGIRKFYYCE